jgi:hypothetical protein
MTDKRLKVKLEVKGRTAVKAVKASFDWWDAGNYNDVAVKRTWERDWVLIPKYTLDEIEKDGGVEALTTNGSAGIVSWELRERVEFERSEAYGGDHEVWILRRTVTSFKKGLDFIRELTVANKKRID